MSKHKRKTYVVMHTPYVTESHRYSDFSEAREFTEMIDASDYFKLISDSYGRMANGSCRIELYSRGDHGIIKRLSSALLGEAAKDHWGQL